MLAGGFQVYGGCGMRASDQYFRHGVVALFILFAACDGFHFLMDRAGGMGLRTCVFHAWQNRPPSHLLFERNNEALGCLIVPGPQPICCRLLSLCRGGGGKELDLSGTTTSTRYSAGATDASFVPRAAGNAHPRCDMLDLGSICLSLFSLSFMWNVELK